MDFGHQCISVIKRWRSCYKTKLHPNMKCNKHTNRQTQQTAFIHISATKNHSHKKKIQRMKWAFSNKKTFTHKNKNIHNNTQDQEHSQDTWKKRKRTLKRTNNKKCINKNRFYFLSVLLWTSCAPQLNIEVALGPMHRCLTICYMRPPYNNLHRCQRCDKAPCYSIWQRCLGIQDTFTYFSLIPVA